ncbi:TPA: LPXTG cell wall anchor domain-containing protein [Streptococcus suis 2651]|uniref:LPXTG cell wall anchor domain-containing protein n=1 Tax=Streptococcus suis TaxID=1307 RepID=UPI0003FF9737|nr:LPXTG cell wall anchor domain-containing protein [Streptococcus suis]HEL1669250.1 LPXTG cell wall anchor domain-containing protein [Streptococcus suis]HEL1754514.1 LPXTG cell wall anchor domain-containing protein [Streptococcus suis]HEM3220840.1 LPXTG cell wall anchor domain-containing protein [Streptococcus suis 2651]
MSKQKVVSSLLLSTVVLGGLAFYSTTTVKAESLEPDVTSVSSSNATNKLVVSNEEESDFLAEEELEESDAPVETLNEEIKDVTEPSSPEALLQPRAMMSNSGSNDTEEIPVDDSVSVSEKIVKTPLIQSSNVDSKAADDQARIRASVSVEPLKVEQNKLEWQVTFDTRAWSFNESPGGLYFVLPKGLKLTSIKDSTNTELFERFPENVESSKNISGAAYRFFSAERNNFEDRGFDDQWGWSVRQASSKEVEEWKSKGLMSKIYFIDNVRSTDSQTYRLIAERENLEQMSFPVAAVMKTFGYTNWSRVQVTSLGAREITLEKEKPLPPKETPAPSAPEEQPKETPAPAAPSTPEKQPESPKEDPKPDAPQDPSTPEEKPQVPEEPKQEPDAPSPEVPTPKEEPAPTPKEEDTPAPKGDAEAPKDEKEVPAPVPTPDVEPAPTPKEEDAPTPVPDTPVPAPAPKEETQEPKTEEKTPETKKETPAPAPIPEVPQVPDAPKDEPQVPSIPEEQPKETPAPEEPKKEDTPQTPQAPSTPKEEAPKEEVPTPPAPSVPEEQPKETPTPEVPKQEDVQPEAPKSDKVESDKPMPETKQPDMKQPKADKPEAEKAQMPRTEGMKPESKASMMPKAEAPKATLPNTGEASSAIGWLGGALATLATGLYLFKNKKEE